MGAEASKRQQYRARETRLNRFRYGKFCQNVSTNNSATRAGQTKTDAIFFGSARGAPKLRPLVRLFGAVLSAAIVAAGAPPASASRVDRTSARMFLADATTYVHISVSHHVQLETAVRRFIEHVHSSCPSVLANAPPPIVEHALARRAALEGRDGRDPGAADHQPDIPNDGSRRA